LICDVPMVLSYDIYISRLLFLIGDVPMVLSYDIYISRLGTSPIKHTNREM
jgi:hypothetical protein